MMAGIPRVMDTELTDGKVVMFRKKRGIRRARSLMVVLLTMLASLVLGLAMAGNAHAEFGVAQFDGDALNADGEVESQAGAHPHKVSMRIDFNLLPDPDPLFGFYNPDGQVRDIEVSLPPGVAANPTVASFCNDEALILSASSLTDCPGNSQIGTLQVASELAVFPPVPIYNMAPPNGVAGQLGVSIGGVVIRLNAEVRPLDDGGYGLTIVSTNTSQALPLLWIRTEIWGIPASPAHDSIRREGEPATIPPKGFFTNPTSCTPEGVGVETRLDVTSWDGDSDSASFFSHDVPPNEHIQVGPTGCENVPFEPSVKIAPTTSTADSPAGLSVDMSFDQAGLEEPDGIASSHLKRAEVTLPEGMSINPASADGLVACTDAQFGLGQAAASSCPAAANISTATAHSPLLGKFDRNFNVMTDENGNTLLEDVEGGVYILSQKSWDPASGEMFRLGLILENRDRGVRIKLAGNVKADPQTGQLTTVFDNNPQMPVSDLRLQLKSGPRAPLMTPATLW